jgi:DMSO/TMAO reductase YedYZ molybdopterin-dependent catalytic subunit
MKRISVILGIILGLLTSIPIIVLTYLGDQLAEMPFVPFDLFDFLARILPGAVVTFGIDTIVWIITSLKLGSLSETAKLAEQTIALIQFVIIGGVFGLVLAALGRWSTARKLPLLGFLGGLVLLLLFIPVEVYLGFPAVGPISSLLWLAIIFGGWGLTLGWLLRQTAVPETVPLESASRRRFLYLLGTGVAALVAGAIGLGFLFRRREPAVEQAQPTFNPGDTSGPAASPSEEALSGRIEPAPGTRPEITANQDFYRIDIDTLPPEIDAEKWQLEITGQVERPLKLTLAEIRSRPAVSQYITLSCISNEIGGDLISTSLWKGVPLKHILEEAGLRPEAQEVYIEAADGFYESVSMADMKDERTLLVYEMNSKPLPAEHGFPLRIYIPNRYGMKQPKWIKRLEIIDREGRGYWVDRGWSKEAIPQTTSVIDNVAVGEIDPERQTVPIGGIAYAGARGISQVEVQVDDEAWQAAKLRIPPLSPLTWVQWRYDWPAHSGRHVARVRAYDGNGDLQILKEQGVRPDGATGVHSFTFRLV